MVSIETNIRIMELREKAAVLLVSHNLASISMLCDRVLWLDEGRRYQLSETSDVVAKYSEAMFARSTEDRIALSAGSTAASGALEMDRIEFAGSDGAVRAEFDSGEKLTIRCHYTAREDLGRPYFQFDVRSPRGYVLFSASMLGDGRDREEILAGPGVVECRFSVPPLQPGSYVMDINVRPNSGIGKLYRQLYAAVFTIRDVEDEQFTGRLATYNARMHGALRVPYEWHTTQRAQRMDVLNTDTPQGSPKRANEIFE